MRQKLDQLNAAIAVTKDNIARTENMAMLKVYRAKLKELESELQAVIETYSFRD